MESRRRPKGSGRTRGTGVRQKVLDSVEDRVSPVTSLSTI